VSDGVLALAAGNLVADEAKKDRTNKEGKHCEATITKVDLAHHTVTVRMRDRDGKEVTKTFHLTEDVRMLDSTGRVAAIDVFQSGDDILVLEAEGHLKEMKKAEKHGKHEQHEYRSGGK
jgi:hypothetical protein